MKFKFLVLGVSIFLAILFAIGTVTIVRNQIDVSQGTPNAASDSEKIGNVYTSGVLLKDSISIERFDDPDISGVSCYVTFANNAMSMEDPTDSSITCVKTARLSGNLTSRSDIFSKNKSPFFKTQRIDRFYDPQKQALVYISYTTKMSGKNAAHDISVVSY